MLTYFRIMVAFQVATLVMACDDGSFKNAGDKEKKKTSQKNPGQIDQTNNNNADVPVAKARYKVSVRAKTGTEVCTGVADVILTRNFRMEPKGVLQCIIVGPLSMESLFGKAPDIPKRNDDFSQLQGFGRIQRSQNPVQLAPGTAIFTPPKPSILGPIIQDPSVYKDFVFKEASSVQGITKEGQSYQGQGEWFIQVHELLTDYEPPDYTGTQKFPSVIRWEAKAAGFEGTPKTDFSAFESMTYWYSTSPIAVPRLQIEGKFKDFFPDGGGTLGSTADIIFSGIQIDVSLLEHTPIQ